MQSSNVDPPYTEERPVQFFLHYMNEWEKHDNSEWASPVIYQKKLGRQEKATAPWPNKDTDQPNRIEIRTEKLKTHFGTKVWSSENR